MIMMMMTMTMTVEMRRGQCEERSGGLILMMMRVIGSVACQPQRPTERMTAPH